MATIDQMIAALYAQRKAHGGGAEVTAIINRDDDTVGLRVVDGAGIRQPVANSMGPEAVAVGWGAPAQVEHGLYLTARAMGDVRAVQRGRLPQRLIRRAVMRRAGNGIFGKW